VGLGGGPPGVWVWSAWVWIGAVVGCGWGFRSVVPVMIEMVS